MPSPLKSHWKSVGSPVERLESKVTGTPVSTVVGLAVNSAIGPGGGVIALMSGKYSICAVALEARWRFWPPKTKDRSGVTGGTRRGR